MGSVICSKQTKKPVTIQTTSILNVGNAGKNMETKNTFVNSFLHFRMQSKAHLCPEDSKKTEKNLILYLKKLSKLIFFIQNHYILVFKGNIHTFYLFSNSHQNVSVNWKKNITGMKGRVRARKRLTNNIRFHIDYVFQPLLGYFNLQYQVEKWDAVASSNVIVALRVTHMEVHNLLQQFLKLNLLGVTSA
ncbi:hypothetical protein pb186bvf_008467 [Paramecium bursaria]